MEVLLRISKERNSPLLLIGRDIQVEPVEGSLDGQSLKVISGGKARRFRIPLLGAHQVTNAATAWAALQASGLAVPDAALRRGFAEVKWRARFEVARREPPLIFDSAHNDDSFARLRETLDTYFPARPVYLIFGASEDKNVPGMLREIKPRVKKLLISRADHPRALTPERIAELADEAGIPHEAHLPVEAALRRALLLSAQDGSIVLSAGSMFVTAEVMAAWGREQGTTRP